MEVIGDVPSFCAGAPCAPSSWRAGLQKGQAAPLEHGASILSPAKIVCWLRSCLLLTQPGREPRFGGKLAGCGPKGSQMRPPIFIRLASSRRPLVLISTPVFQCRPCRGPQQTVLLPIPLQEVPVRSEETRYFSPPTRGHLRGLSLEIRTSDT